MKKEKTWYEILGYKNNPFIIKPYAYNEIMQGYYRYVQKVNSALRKGRIIFIEGDYGVGKTSILKQIIDEFSGKKKLIYYSANRSEGDIDFDSLIRGRAGPLGRLFGIKPKQLILMIDETDKMTMHDVERIDKLLKEKYFKSIVLVSDDFNKVILSKYLKRRIGKNILRLSDILTEKHAFKIIKDRLGSNSRFVTKNIAKEVFEKAGKNPRKLLEYLEDIARYAVEEKGAKIIKEEHVRFVLA